MDTPRRTTSTTSTSQADSSPKSDLAVTTMTTTMSPLNLSPSPEQPFVTSTPVPRKQNLAPSELPAQQQQTLKPPSLRPKLNTILSSDASRFMSLEKLQQNMKNTNPHQERQLTIETAVFPEQQSIFNDKARRGAPQSDARSVRSANDANNHHKRSPSKRSNKRTSSKKRSAQSIKPAEIFARNLSDAVLDANDSDELESFVYRDNRSSLYPALPSFQWASESYVKRIDAGVESFNQHKPRRPVLRSAVSELPSTALLHSSPFHPKQQPKRYQDYYTSDADEESALLNPRGIRRKHYHHHHMAKKRKYILLWIVFALLVAITAMWSCILFTAMPLASFEATGLSNVLGSDKELFFDLHIRARNPNFWSVHVSHASLSVFASSHYVPTFPMDMDTNYTSFSKHMLASPIEFLGTISELDEPLIFEPANFFEPKVTNATTQIQIKYPGKSKDDMSGNERWARIIRYPYELTVRGVVKYHVLPLMQIHSARLCQMARVDPATGDISDLPPSERSVCDEEVLLPAAA